MKHAKLLLVGSLVASSLVAGSAFAAVPAHAGSRVGQHKVWSDSGTLAHSGSFAQRAGGMASLKANVTKTVTNLPNGVQITETTTDAATLAKLNAMFAKEQGKAPEKANPLVTVTKTQLSNGIQTTITSTDAATVTKIQASGGNLGKMHGNGKKPITKKGSIKKPSGKKPAKR